MFTYFWNQFWQQGVEGIKYVAGKAVNLINCPPPVLFYYDPVSDKLENLSASYRVFYNWYPP